MFTKGIDKTTRHSLAVLGQNSATKQFYIAGGTACALRIGHRLSFDLDFFTPESFDAKQLDKKLKKIGAYERDRVTKNTLLGTFLGTKVSFFKYPYPLIAKTELFDHVHVADLADIAAMKIDAVSDRGRKRDFIDLFFIAQKYSLEEILKFYDKKYHLLKTNKFHIAKSLAFFTDAQSDPMPEMTTNVNWSRVKGFFQKEALRLSKGFL